MGRHPDADRVRCAQLAGIVAAIRDVLVLDQGDRLAALRASWPELAQRVERAAELAGE